MQCPYCDYPECQETSGAPDEMGNIEYRCPQCGEYFAEAAQPPRAVDGTKRTSPCSYCLRNDGTHETWCPVHPSRN